MPAKSKKQQQFMAMVAHGKIKGPKGLSKEEARKFAKTKHEGLPTKIGDEPKMKSKKLKEGKMSFIEFLIDDKDV